MTKRIEEALRPGKKRKSPGEKVFSAIVAVFLICSCLLVIYPIYYMFICSISDGYAVTRGEVWLYPKGINLKAYQIALTYQSVMRSFRNSLQYTVVGTAIATILTALCAYPLSRKDMYGRGVFTFIITFTMFFDSGLVANYMVVSSLHLKNTIWAMVLPGAISVWYMIIMRTGFQSIPDALHESAYLDGANDLVIFWKIILPLSKATMATCATYRAVLRGGPLERLHSGPALYGRQHQISIAAFAEEYRHEQQRGGEQRHIRGGRHGGAGKEHQIRGYFYHHAPHSGGVPLRTEIFREGRYGRFRERLISAVWPVVPYRINRINKEERG